MPDIRFTFFDPVRAMPSPFKPDWTRLATRLEDIWGMHVPVIEEDWSNLPAVGYIGLFPSGVQEADRAARDQAISAASDRIVLFQVAPTSVLYFAQQILPAAMVEMDSYQALFDDSGETSGLVGRADVLSQLTSATVLANTGYARSDGEGSCLAGLLHRYLLALACPLPTQPV